jgi:DNA-binding NarL/FixJ family response regulator
MAPSNIELSVAPPPGLFASRFELGEHEFLLLEWPLASRPAPPRLTRAEQEVLNLILAGFSNPEIAARRGRSVRTIANQVASLFRRLDVGSRLELFALFALPPTGEPP